MKFALWRHGATRWIIAAVWSLVCCASAAAQRPTVCIDPGHPSETGRGCHGRRLTEIHIAWVMAKRLRKTLEAAGIHVVMTKARENQTVTNRRRAEIANLAKAALMVRLHCDASAGAGYSIYFPARAGVAGGRRGPSPAVLARSSEAASKFHVAFSRAIHGAFADNGVHGDEKTAIGKKQGALTGSVYSHVPVVLVEMCVLTNRKDEDRIATEKGQAAMAGALAAGVLAAIKRA